MDQLAVWNSWQDALVAGMVLIALYGAALWIAAIVWTYRDARARTDDPFELGAAILMVAVFNIPGLVLYILMRPKETLEDQLDRRLEAEAMFHEIQEHPMCPQCASTTQPDFVFCPTCRTQLRTPCARCSRPLAIDWVMCPFCAHDRKLEPAAAAGFLTFLTSPAARGTLQAAGVE